ncbi:MAG: hypothetical protein IKE49_00830 [Firmicutes bacterium]|nr:hypothetical protein [Bacillota bacterium]
MKKMKAQLLPLLVAAVMVLALAPLNTGVASAAGSTGLVAPTEVKLVADATDNGLLKTVTGSWKEVEGATGYIVTPCEVEKGKWMAIGDAIDIDTPDVSGGTVKCNSLKNPLVSNNYDGGTIGFKVQAYNAEGDKSAAVDSTTIEWYSLELDFRHAEWSSVFGLAGSDIKGLITDYSNLYTSDKLHMKNGKYYTYDSRWEKELEVICFVPEYPAFYGSLEEMAADAFIFQGTDTPAAPLTKCVDAYAVLDSEMCSDGDWHTYERGTVQKATFEDYGKIPLSCTKCNNEDCFWISPVRLVALTKTSYVYTGKANKPKATVIDYNDKVLTEGTEYILKYSNNTKAGKATARVVLTGDLYEGEKELNFSIAKAVNPLNVKGTIGIVKYKKLKKSSQKLLVSKVLRFVKKGQGTVTYTKKGGNKKITIAKKTGKVTIKKGLKKGTYKIKVKVAAAGNGNYKAGAKTVTFKVRVK